MKDLTQSKTNLNKKADPKIKSTAKTKEDPNIWKQLHPQKIQKYKPLGSMFSFNSIKNLWKHQRNFQSRFFVIIHRSNGMYDLHYVYTLNKKFAYNNGAYIIDTDFMKWSDSIQCYIGEYIEGISLPINLKFDEKATSKAIKEDLKGTHVEANVNSNVLLEMVRNEAIQKLAKSEELTKAIALIKTLAIFTLIAIVLLGVFIASKIG